LARWWMKIAPVEGGPGAMGSAGVFFHLAKITKRWPSEENSQAGRLSGADD
jgi:hypothetical protein